MVRILRIAAAAVAMAAVAAIIIPKIWWETEAGDLEAMYGGVFLVLDVASTIGLLIAAGAVFLILIAQARILERLDEIGRSSKHDD